MKPIKVMPCLDMEEGRVVKGVDFVNLRDAGDPARNAAFYQAEGADELAMLDIAATLENCKTRLEWARAVAAVIDVPLTVGGGIGSVEDIELTLAAGADKVSMNGGAVKDLSLVTRAAERFGKEAICARPALAPPRVRPGRTTGGFPFRPRPTGVPTATGRWAGARPRSGPPTA